MEMKRKKISVTSLILPVIMLVVAVVLPMIYSTNYYIQLFSQTLINLVAVLGLNVVMGLAGQTNLGTIALVALGSYTSALISQATGSTNLIGLLAALVVAVLVGFMLGYPSLRVSGIFLSLTTMSVAQIVYSLANSMQWLTGGAMGVKDIAKPNIFGIVFETQAQLYYFILVIAILLIIFSVRLTKSKYGRALKAVRDNPEAVESVGLSVTKLKLMAFLIATILGCLAGVFYTWVMQYVAPTTFTTDNGTKFVVMLPSSSRSCPSCCASWATIISSCSTASRCCSCWCIRSACLTCSPSSRRRLPPSSPAGRKRRRRADPCPY